MAGVRRSPPRAVAATAAAASLPRPQSNRTTDRGSGIDRRGSGVAASASAGAAAGPPIRSRSPVAATAERAASPPPPPSGAGAAPPGDAGPRLPAIDWERWIGVRGAAVLGGIVLALAGILFVRYSIEHGLISPALRVAMGILTGLASIAGSEWLRKRGYRINADALAGAGIVLLYAALWAAHSLYGFVGPGVAYALMSLITVACGVLSWRNASLLIAVLGLAGGFATPFLIAAKSENPIGLFGYVLLLDLGLIALARRRGFFRDGGAADINPQRLDRPFVGSAGPPAGPASFYSPDRGGQHPADHRWPGSAGFLPGRWLRAGVRRAHS